MIVYGSRAVHLKSALLNTVTCESCGTKGSILLSLYRKHAHIFWIPLFPFGKTGVSQCQHCKSAFEKKEMPEPIEREYNRLKGETRGPIWQFAGIALIALLILWGNYASGQSDKRNQEYIASPTKGDIYKYTMESGSYSTLKVTEVSKDSVFVCPNEYAIGKVSKIYKIDKSENYSKMSYGISKDRIKEMFETGDILGVKR